MSKILSTQEKAVLKPKSQPSEDQRRWLGLVSGNEKVKEADEDEGTGKEAFLERYKKLEATW